LLHGRLRGRGCRREARGRELASRAVAQREEPRRAAHLARLRVRVRARARVRVRGRVRVRVRV